GPRICAMMPIVTHNNKSKKIVYSRHSDLIPRILKNEGYVEEGDEESQEVTTEETKSAIAKIVNAAYPKNLLKQSGDSKWIKYKPSQQSASAFNSGAKERIIKVSEKLRDPLDPPKLRHKRVPVASGSPDPVPVMHSPPRAVTDKERQDWRIPPCVSNWKNQKGYTIPLDKRLATNGRVLQEVQINDNFAKFSETLDVAVQKVREGFWMRLQVQREIGMKEKERKEQELRALAQKARSERTGAASESVDEPRGNVEHEEEERIQRKKIREERRRERRRVEAKKSKITRDRDRDVSEKVALGMAFAGGRGGGVMYDQRLFNQEKGMDSGFATDDRYNVYDKGLFTAQPTLSTLYRPQKDMDDEMYGNADEQLHKLKNTEKRERPVEFEKEGEEQDLFGLKRWVSDLKKGKKILD
ncbi:hypothetical protein EUTSA_v10009601mg, partial [Eutrema salsugineum]